MFKNKTRTFLLLTLIFIAVLGLSTISATDIDDNQTSTVNTYKYTSHSSENNIENEISNKNPEINKNKDNNIKSVDGGTFTDLNTKISDNDDITLENDYIKDDDETQITVSKKININGNGKTIESDNGLFTITSTGNVTFRNVNFIGGSGSNSAFTVNGILNLINCTFAYHTSNSRAFDVTSDATVTAINSSFHDIESQGAFYLAARTTAEFRDCEFTNCMNTVYGGAITNYRSGTLTIDNCTFTGNTAAQRGGAVYSNGGTLIVKNSTFTQNEVQINGIGNHQGGKALYVEGSVYLYNNTMTNNRGVSADIFNSYATIHTPVTIIINNASCNEGESVNLTASVTDDNGNSIDLISEPTGIIGMDESLNLTHFNFTIDDNKYDVARNQSVNGIITRLISHNLLAGLYDINAEYWADEFSDATVIPGTLNVTETPLYSYQKLQNMIDETSESILVLDYDVKRGVSESNVNLTGDMTIDLNGHTWDATTGQAMEILNNANVVIKNGVIVNVNNLQPSSTNSYGRLARITSGALVFENITLTNSSAPDFSNYYKGSLIRLSTNAAFTLNNSKITGIKGRFIIDNGRGTLYINNSQFTANKLGTTDSLIEINGKTSIDNTVFDANTANLGLIYGNNQKELLTLNNVTFTNNIITVGAPVVTGDDTDVLNSRFLNNKATSMNAKSGAIYTNGGSLTVTNSTFMGNTANDNDGSIIHHSGYLPGDLTVTNSILIPADNSAAIYNEAEDDIEAVANYNYWGTNSTPAGYVKSGSYEDDYGDEYDCSPVELRYWVVMNTTAIPSENLKVGETIAIETSYDTYTDGTNYNLLEGSMPDIDVEYAASSGSIESPVTTIGGRASANYKIESESVTITASDSYNTNILELTATVPEALNITLNDGNWSYYFDEEGFVRESVVTPGSQLMFEGQFNGRAMFITIPLNLTTAENQAVLKNSLFIIEASNVNITRIIMTATDMENPLIALNDVSNITVRENNLTLTNNEDKIVTHAIEVFGGKDNSIQSNTITTCGPEDAIDYTSDGTIRTLYTTSILAASENIIIDGNNITTKCNDYSEELGTIYGIYIKGDDEENTTDNVQITNNQITVTGKIYDYGIKVDWANNALIENNTVNSNGDLYTSGIHPFGIINSTINNNTINGNAENIAYGIVLEGALNYETENLITPKQNKVTNNRVNIESKYAWGIETYAGEENSIEYNNITLTTDNAVGIGLTDQNSKASFNNIQITAAMQQDIVGTFDYITPETAGIKIVENGLGTVQSNNATYNNVTVTAPYTTVPAVNTTTNNNIVTNNYLISPYGKGNYGVLDDGEENRIEDNMPNVVETVIIAADVTIIVGDEELLSFEVLDVEDRPVNGGEVKAYIDGQLKDVISLNIGGANIVDISGLAVGNHTLLLEYSNPAGAYENSNKTANIEVIKRNYDLTVSIDENVVYMDEVQISGKLFDGDEMVADKAIKIMLNGRTLTTQTTDDYGEIEYTVDAKVIGVNNITFNIAGDSNHNDFTGDYIFNVSKGSITISISDIGEMIYNEDVWIMGEVSEDNGNMLGRLTLSVTVNNKTYTTKTVGGSFEYTVKADTIGVNNITVTFGGDDYYKNSTATCTFMVYKLNTFLTLEDINDTIVGSDILIAGDLYDELDQPLVNHTLHITINGITVDVKTIEDGIYGFLFEADTAGQNNVTVTYDGSTALEGSQKETTFIVEKQKSKLTLDKIENTKYNSTITLTGKLEDITGKAIHDGSIALLVNDVEATVFTDEDGTFTYTYITNITGVNNVSAVFDDENYESSMDKTSFNVSKLSSKITIDALGDVKLNTRITVSGNVVDENLKVVIGQVNLLINNVPVNVKTDNSGKFAYNMTVTRMGKNNVTVTFAGNDYCRNSTATSSFTAGKLKVNLSLENINSIIIGQDVLIVGDLYDEQNRPVGDETVHITINGITVDVKTTADGVYGFLFEADTAGQNNVTVKYDGSTGLEGAQKSTTFNVEKQETKLTIDRIYDTKYNSTITISGKLVDKSGKAISAETVAMLVNDVEATVITGNDGVFTYNYKANITGVNNVSAVFDDNGIYADSMALASFNVSRLATTISLDALKDTKLNSRITISGNVMDENRKAVVGQVNLLINNARATVLTDNNGKFTYNYTMTRIGTNNITATFRQTDIYLSSNDTAKVTVTQLNTKITLKSIKNVKLGETVTVSGQLLDENNKGFYGTVKLLISNARATVKTDDNGMFSYNYTTSRVGVNNVTASYVESAKYKAGNATATFNVLQKSTRIILNPIKAVKFGNVVTISGQLCDENNKGIYGTVKLLINTGRATVKTDDNGMFSYNYTTSRVGVNNVTASYVESVNYKAGNAKASFNVLQKSTKIVFTTIKSVQLGENITINGQLCDENGKGIYGTVKLLINTGRATIKTDNNGMFTYTFKTTKVGINNITASYLESTKYTASNTTTTVTIKQQNTKLTINPIKTVTQKTNITITGKLSDKNGNAVYGTVKLLINNGRATVKTDNNGIYSYTYNATRVGVNNVTASYLGSDKYIESSTTTSFTVQAKTQ